MCRWSFILHWLIWLLTRRLQYTTHLLRMAFNAFAFLWSLFYKWYIFRFNYFIYFTCINVLPTCLVLKNSTEGLRSPAPGVADDCKLPWITELTSSVRVTSAHNPWVVGQFRAISAAVTCFINDKTYKGGKNRNIVTLLLNPLYNAIIFFPEIFLFYPQNNFTVLPWFFSKRARKDNGNEYTDGFSLCIRRLNENPHGKHAFEIPQ